MKRHLYILGTALCLTAIPAAAQTELPRLAAGQTDDAPTAVADTARTEDGGKLSLSLPWSMAAPGLSTSPFGYWGCGDGWRLHEGFNAQFSMSLSAAFGRHAPHGVGFGQGAALAYALPLSGRLSLAAGLYASNLDWGAMRRTEVGLAGILSYKVNDAVNLYAYATKSLTPRRNAFAAGPFPLFQPLGGDRIGAMAEFKVGRNAAIQVGVEHRSDNFIPGGLVHETPSMKPYGW